MFFIVLSSEHYKKNFDIKFRMELSYIFHSKPPYDQTCKALELVSKNKIKMYQH